MALSRIIVAVPNLVRCGSAALVWPRLSPRRVELGAAAFALEQQYAACREFNAYTEKEIGRAVRRLRKEGIETVLLKGWSISRFYPSPGMRPAGDIDLWAGQEDVERAKELLLSSENDPIEADIDLQDHSNLSF